jgi:hypothetical protein
MGSSCSRLKSSLWKGSAETREIRRAISFEASLIPFTVQRYLARGRAVADLGLDHSNSYQSCGFMQSSIGIQYAAAAEVQPIMYINLLRGRCVAVRYFISLYKHCITGCYDTAHRRARVTTLGRAVSRRDNEGSCGGGPRLGPNNVLSKAVRPHSALSSCRNAAEAEV